MLTSVLTPYLRLGRDVHLVAAVKFVLAFSDFVFPFLGLYLIYHEGMSKGTAGAVVTLLAITYVPAVVVGGRLARTLSVRGTAAALGVSALCCVCVPAVPTPAALLLLAAARFALSMIDPRLGVLVAEGCPAEQRKAAFSLLYLVMNVGFATGPLVAAFTYRYCTDALFVLDGAGTALVALLVLRLGWGPAVAPAGSRPSGGGAAGYFALLRTQAGLAGFAALMAGYNVVYAQTGFTLPVFLQGAFGPDGAVYLGYLMSVNAASVLVLSPWLLRVAGELSPVTCLVLTGLLYAVGFGGYAVVHGLLTAMLATVVWSAGEVLWYTNMNVLVAERFGGAGLGLATALVSGAARTGTFVNPALFGWLAGFLDVRALWLVVGAGALAGAAGMHALRPHLAAVTAAPCEAAE